MRQSMTGFASGQGAAHGLRWSWELRGVNGKGLDLRLRVPDWIDGLEQALKAEISAAVARGNVTLNCRVSSEDETGALTLNAAQMRSVLDAMAEIEAEAMERGLTLGPSTAADIVAVRGVLDTSAREPDVAALRTAMIADFAPVLVDFVAMRHAEGAALVEVLMRQINEIETLVEVSQEAVSSRRDEQAGKLRAALARVMDNADGVDETRVAQELALIAVKSDVTEELDRLRTHIAAARELLAAKGPVGRKFDFLMQEFNREANTLCSKSQNAELTRAGLALKTVIDQLREQVQNVE
ncbi:YicC/YloC family endoribonuclease [Mesobacterium sp. TK19101]|uniref:YicC/YloC family endoribonuclease n=1 Tax=Mesobacterium hydrothermale TaxID=3111907 RepID=A0ABU6HJX9_9RHOB|nr:YicC/YloC family endoribonuclease [Mesobacterium sp. TK19101]MEC3862209.1 YicC/YloC family endoribonuclease [Mesobacterium sp. TK19101]